MNKPLKPTKQNGSSRLSAAHPVPDIFWCQITHCPFLRDLHPPALFSCLNAESTFAQKLTVYSHPLLDSSLPEHSYISSLQGNFHFRVHSHSEVLMSAHSQPREVRMPLVGEKRSDTDVPSFSSTLWGQLMIQTGRLLASPPSSCTLTNADTIAKTYIHPCFCLWTRPSRANSNATFKMT